ncbi:MAG: MSEP-CTERM sorting domain-containing protein, partial [Phycisphaerales bacterium]
IKAEIELLLTNKGPSISEFATDIQLDQGVMISGYWLNIGSEKVAGKIFEKKAAMWVYHMIRDFTRRDPGILIYKNQTAAQLSVYPFEANQSRTTGIELLYPAGLNPSIIVGSKQVALYNDQLSPSQQIMLANNDESTVAFVPAPVLQQLPAVQRKPYIHFIVDKSLKARKSFDTFAKTMSDIAEKYSPTDQCKITFANYDSSDVNVFVAINEIENAVKSPASKSITFEGAFCYSNIIKQKLLEFKDKNASCDNLDVPVFVVIKAPDSNSVALGQMAPFGQITPDIQKYYIALKDGMFDAIGFDGKQTIVERIESADSSILFKYGSSYAICVKDSNFAIAKFPSTEKNVLEVYEPARNTFFEINDVKPLADDSTYEKGLALWNKYNESIYYPYKAETQLPEIVKMSKESGIMVPATSYMVVENSSQQEILKRKEKQSLNANQAYEFDEYMESPAPSILFIAPIALFLLHKIKRRHNLTSNLIK